jgi:hypothetical protein
MVFGVVALIGVPASPGFVLTTDTVGPDEWIWDLDTDDEIVPLGTTLVIKPKIGDQVSSAPGSHTQPEGWEVVDPSDLSKIEWVVVGFDPEGDPDPVEGGMPGFFAFRPYNAVNVPGEYTATVGGNGGPIETGDVDSPVLIPEASTIALLGLGLLAGALFKRRKKD